uniref:ATP synthase CF0 B chain n=1 Tax=Gloeochaete wittrockiana TaxID=38269 RepID=A0A3G1IVW9_9EUKA|nr:ATP synthase CF0 B chain [Gloeochaete wittrockiana]ASQ40181.1 ATP synthase CF0 B chain [Gloeochaete wittrockiana]
MNILIFNFIFHLNTNILETNFLNILVILFLLTYVGYPFLTSILFEREKRVLVKLKESSIAAVKAAVKLAEARRKYARSEVFIKQIYDESNKIIENYRSTSLEQLEQNLNRLEQSLAATIQAKEKTAKQELKEKFISLIISRVIEDGKSLINESKQQQFVDNQLTKIKISQWKNVN